MGRILCIDYGLKRCGIAVTDPLQILARGLDTIKTSEILSFLENYFQDEQVDAVVIGRPAHNDGKETSLTPVIEKFIIEFEKKFKGIQVCREDERFTSVEAKEIILKSGVNRKKRQDKGLIDRVSAVVILEHYMRRIGKW